MATILCVYERIRHHLYREISNKLPNAGDKTDIERHLAQKARVYAMILILSKQADLMLAYYLDHIAAI